MKRSFLKAEWKNLAFVNYIVDQNKLVPYLPYGTELDLWSDKCIVSLVGFMFKNTRVFGIKIPFHSDFEEVNLRLYVKRFENNNWKRGVVFIKEIVPKRAVSYVANTVYNENYETMKMFHKWHEAQDSRVVEYAWEKSGVTNFFKVEASIEAYEIEPNSETEFIAEHYWGYAKINDEKSNEYQVDHPKWKIYKVYNYEVNVDFGSIYNEAFHFLNESIPHSVILAEGSSISVAGKKLIK